MIKGQDIAILLKLALNNATDITYAALASDIGISPSEAHAGVRRLAKVNLIDAASKKIHLSNSLEFITHGMPYVFPLEPIGGLCRGVPTAHAAPFAAAQFNSGSEPSPVWPDAEGTVRGTGVKPLYKGASKAARGDADLYKLLALTDMLRGGRARERNWALSELETILAKTRS